MTEYQKLLTSSKFQNARADLLAAISEAQNRIREVKPSSPELREKYQAAIKEFQIDRGRELYFQYLSSGLGAGPYVELADGSVKLDLITGIGVNFFGHGHPDVMAEAVTAVFSDVMHGNLQPGVEANELLRAILSRTTGSRLKHGWLTTCGTMANENALKMIRQKKHPATKVLAFRDCFAGRSLTMAEITDNPGYRVGQPLYGEVLYLPFYDSKLTLDRNIEMVLAQMREHIARYGDKIAAIMMEPIQGEGGFNFAPRDWYVRIFDEAKKAGLIVWLDEIQTFARTGQLFAFQSLNLGEYVDVVTVAKALQASVVLFTEELNPKPGLMAGTFTGSAVALRAGRRVLEVLDQGYLGPTGKIQARSDRMVSNLKALSEGSCKGKIGDIRAFGGMIGFVPLEGKMDQVKKVLMKLFDLGVVAFYCGHGPYLIRMLPALPAMEDKDIDLACSIIEKALLEVQA